MRSGDKRKLAFILRRAEKIERHKKRQALKKKRNEKKKKIRFKGVKHIKAPAEFSFIDNTYEVIDFFESIRMKISQRYAVVLDFRKITTVTMDALFMLISQVIRRNSSGIRVSGNLPENKSLRRIMLESGFFGLVNLTEKDGEGLMIHGSLVHSKGKKVENHIAGKAMHFVSKHTLNNAENLLTSTIYDVLVECMSNTLYHSSESGELERWWIFWNADASTGVSRICFVDYGMGIFGSLKGKLDQVSEKFLQVVDGTNRSQILLERIIDGKIKSPSKEGKPYRGNGLRNMKLLSDMVQTRKFTIVSNDAAGFISEREKKYYNLRERSLRGTFIYMEIHPN